MSLVDMRALPLQYNRCFGRQNTLHNSCTTAKKSSFTWSVVWSRRFVVGKLIMNLLCFPSISYVRWWRMQILLRRAIIGWDRVPWGVCLVWLFRALKRSMAAKKRISSSFCSTLTCRIRPASTGLLRGSAVVFHRKSFAGISDTSLEVQIGF